MNRDDVVSTMLRVAAVALDIAADWHVEEVELVGLSVPEGCESEVEGEGWASTSALAQRCRELAQMCEEMVGALRIIGSLQCERVRHGSGFEECPVACADGDDYCPPCFARAALKKASQ